MSIRASPRVFSIPPGAPFLPTLVASLLDGRLLPDFRVDNNPLALTDVTIYVPTRRAARALRSVLVEAAIGHSTILPVIKPLGEFDDNEYVLETEGVSALDLTPPISSVDRLLMLAPLVRAWRRCLPAHVSNSFKEEVLIPASTADAVWLTRDIVRLMDEIETEGSDWAKLAGLVSSELSSWWQVTLDLLSIIASVWPDILAEHGRSNPAAHRNALIRLEAERLLHNPSAGPVIAAGSTGSIPATAELLVAIANLPRGAVVIPGFDATLDEASLEAITASDLCTSVLGHPQYGLIKLIGKIGMLRRDIEELGTPSTALVRRATIVGEALRPTETTNSWAEQRGQISDAEIADALAGITLLEAAHERDEAAAIAIALREAVAQQGHSAALVTSDRNLARRVASELRRFGIRGDDSGGVPLANTLPAVLLRTMVEAVIRPGDPVAILSLLKHPLLRLELKRPVVRRAAETIELVMLRGVVGRPNLALLAEDFDTRLTSLSNASRKPFWFDRITVRRIDEARDVVSRLIAAIASLTAFHDDENVELNTIVRVTVEALENLGRDHLGGLATLYDGDVGSKLAEVLRGLVSAQSIFSFAVAEWPDVLDALIATEVVKPSNDADRAISIWGALEARLQTVDTLVIGALNEGSWPRKVEADRFMSRVMKAGINLEPPERRIGLAAHDFQMAMGAKNVILSRSARTGDAPAVQSRWLQRLLTYIGPNHAAVLRKRGERLLGLARQLDAGTKTSFATRPEPKPPVAVRPRRFSVTEIETLRRDPYAVYARRILCLSSIDPLVRDPGAAERGTQFHNIMHLFSATVGYPLMPEARDALIAVGQHCFAAAALPADVEAVWWPRFERMADGILEWEHSRSAIVVSRYIEESACATEIGHTGITLYGRADRIDLLADGMADIIDYKTGSSPSKAQAHTLIAPQLALEGALLRRGAFRKLGKREPSQLAFVRFMPNGEVFEESILEYNRKSKSATELSEEAWMQLEQLLVHYDDPDTGYLSRAMPLRESETDGDYDHLARVLEWSVGGDGGFEGKE